MVVFPHELKWSPTLRRALWRCRNVGFPGPECRVTAPISAVWWPEEEATEILAWRKKRKKKGGTTAVGKARKDFFFLLSIGICPEREERSNETPTRLFGWTPPLSAHLCRCVPLPPRPLGGSKTGFGECRSSVAKLAKSERLGGERRDKILPFPVNVI